MGLLTAGELTQMRATASRNLPETCTIKRPSLANDGAGGQTETLTTIASGVACRLATVTQPVSSKIAPDAGRLVEQATHVVSFAQAQAVELNDQIEIGARVFRAIFIYEQSQRIALRVACVEL